MRFSHFIFITILLFSSFESKADINRALRFGMGTSYALGYKTSGTITYSTTSNGINMGGGDLEMELENAPSVDFDLRYSPVNSWGLILGYSLDLGAKIERMKMAINGSSFEARIIGDEKIQASSILISTVRRWEKFFIPFGLNVTQLKFKSDDPRIEMSGGVGFQFGAGYWFTNNLVGEFYYKFNSIDLSLRDPDTTLHLDYITGTLTKTSLGIKYFF